MEKSAASKFIGYEARGVGKRKIKIKGCEDCLYPAIYFYPVELPQIVQETFRLAA